MEERDHRTRRSGLRQQVYAEVLSEWTASGAIRDPEDEPDWVEEPESLVRFSEEVEQRLAKLVERVRRRSSSGLPVTHLVRDVPDALSELLSVAEAAEGSALLVPCGVLTQPGDRIVLYQGEADRGVVALARALSDAHLVDDGVLVCHASVAELPVPVPLRKLREAGLGPALRRARPATNLDDHETVALESLIRGEVEPPFFERPDAPVESVDAAPGLGEAPWFELEKDLQHAILADPDAVRALGIGGRVLAEHRVRGGAHRFDIFGPDDRVVVECKRWASVADLAQLERYLEVLHEDRGASWRGILLFSDGCSRQVVRAVEAERVASEALGEEDNIRLDLLQGLKRPAGTVWIRSVSSQTAVTPTFAPAIFQLLTDLAFRIALLTEDVVSIASVAEVPQDAVAQAISDLREELEDGLDPDEDEEVVLQRHGYATGDDAHEVQAREDAMRRGLFALRVAIDAVLELAENHTKLEAEVLDGLSARVRSALPGSAGALNFADAEGPLAVVTGQAFAARVDLAAFAIGLGVGSAFADARRIATIEDDEELMDALDEAKPPVRQLGEVLDALGVVEEEVRALAWAAGADV